MTHAPQQPEISIRTPCPKRWEELAGDERRRFCSECCLHVHNSAALTRAEAGELVRGAGKRVCMRIEYDPAGAPLFREEARGFARLSRWALATGAALLAACHAGSGSAADPKPVEPPSKMGRVAAPAVMGDVAVAAPAPVERLGEAVAKPDPAAPKPK
jgi:hypothetical protein